MKKILYLTLLLSTAANANNIEIKNAWAKTPGPNGAVFMEIENTGNADNSVIGATSEAAKIVELHTHKNEGNIYRMREVGEIKLPAKCTTTLKPGGLHIMLIGLNEPLKEGDEVPLTITLENGTQIGIDVPVKSVAACGCKHK